MCVCESAHVCLLDDLATIDSTLHLYIYIYMCIFF